MKSGVGNRLLRLALRVDGLLASQVLLQDVRRWFEDRGRHILPKKKLSFVKLHPTNRLKHHPPFENITQDETPKEGNRLFQLSARQSVFPSPCCFGFWRDCLLKIMDEFLLVLLQVYFVSFRIYHLYNTFSFQIFSSCFNALDLRPTTLVASLEIPRLNLKSEEIAQENSPILNLPRLQGEYLPPKPWILLLLYAR